MILVVTNKIDSHSDIIIEKFHERNIDFCRFNTEDYPGKYNLYIDYTNKDVNLMLKTPVHGTVDLNEVESIWYRRPEDSEVSEDIKDKNLIEFVQKESKKTLMWLWDILQDKFWVNHPRNNIPASSKLHQQRFARSQGLRIPDTLITNTPSKAKQFVKSHENVVTKPISGGFIERDGEFSYMYTNLLTSDDLERIDLVEYCPTLFQEYIPKDYELRITVIGDRIFACKIESQQSEKTKHDWRRYDHDNVPHSPFELPADIKEFCFGLVNYFNLNFGAIDMIVTPEGEYVFLEINPNGQWGWIEILSGMPISEAVIEVLTKKISTSKVKESVA